MRKISSKIVRKKRLLKKPYRKKLWNFWYPTNKGYITFILLGLAIAALLFAGSLATFNTNTPQDNSHYILVTPPTYGGYNSLELHTLKFITPTPSPTSAPPTSNTPSNFCTKYGNNTGAGELITAGYYPGPGQTAGAGGQVKVWVGDEHPPCVGAGEAIDSTGHVIPGTGNHTETAADGYLWEPALYIGTLSGSGGTPHFPTMIKGTYNNAAKSGTDCSSSINQINGPSMDPIQSNGLQPNDTNYEDEYIWDVSSLGLAPGTYPAEFIIHDGDDDRGGYCVTITI